MLTSLIATGQVNPLLLAGTALVLGGLHGLEPGHGKTMMAAYIVAIRGTVGQGVLLGVSAAFSHSIAIWVLVALALSYGDALIGDQAEPWFMILSGVIIVGISLHRLVAARHATAWHNHHDHDRHHHHPNHAHDHARGAVDAHTLKHARALNTRVNSGRTTTLQTILFGLSGGLVPCPAAITVLILCVNLGQVGLGATLVAAFSAGLAVTLVAAGSAAAIGLNALSARTSRLDALFTMAPWLSGFLIMLIGIAIMASGWLHLARQGVAL